MIRLLKDCYRAAKKIVSGLWSSLIVKPTSGLAWYLTRSWDTPTEEAPAETVTDASLEAEVTEVETPVIETSPEVEIAEEVVIVAEVVTETSLEVEVTTKAVEPEFVFLIGYATIFLYIQELMNIVANWNPLSELTPEGAIALLPPGSNPIPDLFRIQQQTTVIPDIFSLEMMSELKSELLLHLSEEATSFQKPARPKNLASRSVRQLKALIQEINALYQANGFDKVFGAIKPKYNNKRHLLQMLNDYYAA